LTYDMAVTCGIPLVYQLSQWHCVTVLDHELTRKPCYCKDDCVMHLIYKLFTLILFMLMATILCADFDSERI